jgi:hypothetical protein
VLTRAEQGTSQLPDMAEAPAAPASAPIAVAVGAGPEASLSI